MSKKKSKGGSKKGKPNGKKAETPSNRWTDELDFCSDVVEDVAAEDRSAPSTSLEIRIVSWNVLAESYLNRKSHRSLPFSYQEIVFSPKKRRPLLRKTIRALMDLQVDFLCLQEVDLDDIKRELSQDAYVGVSTPTTSGGGAGGRADACCIYYQKGDWKLVAHQVLRLDDLATLGSTATSIDSNLQGLQQSFLRRNAAIMAKLEHRETGQQIVVVNAHLFWNPEYEYVKLCQAHYITTKTKEFANCAPVIMCGDLNSQPLSCVHTYLTQGKVNARHIAPWNHQWQRPEEDDDVGGMDGVNQAAKQLERMQISSKPRYICDYTLNRFTRWLRILGVDCALETAEEELLRTKESKNQLFHRCRTEQRTLITTSTKLVLRKDCPAGTYLITPRSINDLEYCLVHMLLTHGVTLTPSNFLSTCVVCNGTIVNVIDDDSKRSILAANAAPEHLIDELEVYECNGCGQGYWWCDRPTSSASRVKGQATRLLELCLRGGVPVDGDWGIFDFVDIEKERCTKLEMVLERLDCVDWLKDEALTNPLELESAYALRDEKGEIVGESCAFTNVTHDFVGLLDYVLFERTHFTKTGQLYIPTSFNELNKKYNIRNGHLLPSDVWPSDHLAVGAQFTIEIGAKETTTDGDIDSGIVGDAPPELTSSSDHDTKDDEGALTAFCLPVEDSPPRLILDVSSIHAP
jgi:mRNA deadenylase 3'-5' endonuclease subunit Ccr4/uncharacterized protein with PIN domain